MIPNPHDLLFKGVFSQPEHARGMLRAIAPAVLAEALDWSTLALQPGSFVDVVLSSRHTDLLYSTTWRDGGEALVYLLFEHQSAPPTEELMAERLLRYQGRIWDRWRVDHPKAKALPMILPIVMYHGKTPWSEPRSFDAVLDVPAGLRPAVEPYLVRFEYVLFNEHVEPEELQGLLERDLGREAKDAIMTAGQRLIEQGRQQGIQQGIQQGTQGVLLRLLRQRFRDAVNAQVEQRIATAPLELVEAWTGRVLSATTLAEVFAD